jgi:hypothetical protein
MIISITTLHNGIEHKSTQHNGNQQNNFKMLTQNNNTKRKMALLFILSIENKTGMSVSFC